MACKDEQGGGGGFKTRETWANVLFECPPKLTTK